jgi:hypothetical protein
MALEMERNIDRGGGTRLRVRRKPQTFGELIDLHNEDMKEIGRPVPTVNQTRTYW